MNIIFTEVLPDNTHRTIEYADTLDNRCIRIPNLIKETTERFPNIGIILNGIIVHMGKTDIYTMAELVNNYCNEHIN